jgi:hypothetical protein
METLFGLVPTGIGILLAAIWGALAFFGRGMARSRFRLLCCAMLVVCSSAYLGSEGSGFGGLLGERMHSFSSHAGPVGSQLFGFCLLLATIGAALLATDWLGLSVFVKRSPVALTSAGGALAVAVLPPAVERLRPRGAKVRREAEPDSDPRDELAAGHEPDSVMAVAEPSAEMDTESSEEETPWGVRTAIDEALSDAEGKETEPSLDWGRFRRPPSGETETETGTETGTEIETETETETEIETETETEIETETEATEIASAMPVSSAALADAGALLEPASLTELESVIDALPAESKRRRSGDDSEEEPEEEEAADDEDDDEAEEEGGEDEGDAGEDEDEEEEDEQDDDYDDDEDVDEDLDDDVDDEDAEDEDEDFDEDEDEEDDEEEDDDIDEEEDEDEEEDDDEDDEDEDEEEEEDEGDVDERDDDYFMTASESIAATAAETLPASVVPELQPLAESPPVAESRPIPAADLDETFRRAVDCVLEQGRATISLLQESLGVRYFEAAKLLDQLEQQGIIGQYSGSLARPVLISKQAWDARLRSSA